MAKLNKLKTDPDLEENGVWMNWVYDVELKIARLSNANFASWYRKATRQYTRGGAEIPDEILTKITTKGIAKYVLLDWRNLEDEDGNEIVHSEEKALEMFELLPDMLTFVLRISREEEFYRREDEEAAAKN